MTYNITLTANHQSLTAKYLPLAAESVQYLTAKVVYETDDWTGREVKAMFEQGRTVYKVPVTGGEITAKQQLNLTAGDWRVWLVGNSARDGDVIPRITTNIAHIIVAPTGGTEGNPFPVTPPTVEEQLRADMGNLADLTTEDKSSLVAAINEVRQTGGGGVQSDWNQNDSTQPDYIKNRPFYTGDPVETVLVEESTVSFSFSEDQGLYIAEFRSTVEATAGGTYKVSWDGTAYECTCVPLDDMSVIGNLSIVGAGSDTGEPFVMVVYNGRGIAIGTADTSASHTFSISGIVQEVVKIDKKYLVQPDWNQNDSTQPDYIKNRPFYTGNPVETVFVEESTVSFSFSENEGVYMARFPSTFEATVGETYKVSWDGTVYECACVIFNNMPFIGNLSIIGPESDTGEPFVMVVYNGRGIAIGTADTSASHTFSISGIVQEVVKIDPKYIRDMYYTGDPVETVLVEESTVSFSFSESEGAYMGELASTFSATVGETYKVSWDGTTYECACVNFDDSPAIGNLSIAGAGSDTGEPFIMIVDNGREIIIATADTSASHTISISGLVSEVVKIDPKYLPNTVATKSEVEVAQTTANAAQTTAENAQSTANAALPKTGGTMSGNLTIDTENDSYQTIISPGEMALQYVRPTGSVDDLLVISGRNPLSIVAREDGPVGFKLSGVGLSLGHTSEDKDGIHLYHSNGSSSPGQIVIRHTDISNQAKERISIASTGRIACNNRLQFDCGSEIEVVQTYGKTGGSAIILWSSTAGSTKKFRITVDDSGTISATEVS